MNNYSLFNSCGGGYASYYPSICHPFHTVISLIFRRCDGGDMLVINASNNTGNPEGLWGGGLCGIELIYMYIYIYLHLVI